MGGGWSPVALSHPREVTTFKATWGEVIVFSNVTSGELAILQCIASHLCYKSSLYLINRVDHTADKKQAG